MARPQGRPAGFVTATAAAGASVLSQAAAATPSRVSATA